ncbi:MAG: hypothetical protein Q7U53_17485 [Anaerolineaceae bacterium]|nr:hypothetical protein [Anaerolineaceae bacterium]
MKEWVMLEGSDSCESCKAANGQRHDLTEWEESRIVPGSEWLLCGKNCKCTLEDVADSEPVGNLSDIPLRDFDPSSGEVVKEELSEMEVTGKEVIDLETGELNEVVEMALDEELELEEDEPEQVRIAFEGESVKAVLNTKGEKDEVSYDVVAITAGEGNGWQFSASALRDSVGHWEGVETFIDHGMNWGGRSVRDLAGVCTEARFDEELQGIRVRLKPFGPSAQLLEAIGREWLEVEGVKPRIGFSADLLFSGKGKEVQQIVRVFSVDLVYRPARGGAFLRALNSLQESYLNRENEGMEEEVKEKMSEKVELQQSNKDQEIIHAMYEMLLNSKIASSKLPEALSQQVRKQFSGKDFSEVELDQSIQEARELFAALQGGGIIQGTSGITNMVNERDRLQAAADDLLGAPRDASMQGVKVARLSGIRELYTTLTGDSELRGGYFPERVTLADSDSVSNVIKNAFNKIMIDQWDQLGRAGYRWWEKVVSIEHMDSLQPVSGVLLGEVTALGIISEGGSYGELEIADSGESQNFRKYGGLLPITLEMMDKDETHKLRQLPKKMISSAVRNISSLVSGIFTGSNGTGPIMADGAHVFDAIVHENLGTTALSTTSFENASMAIYNQNMVSNDTEKPKLALDAKYLLVPRNLRLTAMRILYPTFERESNIFSENLQRGELGDVITIPAWSDANDWAVMADPKLAPGIIIAERFGIMPELYVADSPFANDMIHNDVIQLKVRHFLSIFVADYRPLYKANVA